MISRVPDARTNDSIRSLPISGWYSFTQALVSTKSLLSKLAG
jgi:hypothetical protein